MKQAPVLRLGRVLAVSLALLANTFAAGVPLVHAVAHERAREHHPASLVDGVGPAEHEHHEVHPQALHDEIVPVQRQPLDLAFVVPDVATGLVVFTAPSTVQHHPPLRLASRGPPSTDHARAPPLA